MENIQKSWQIKDNNHVFQGHIPAVKLAKGSLKGKKEVRIDDRTVVWVDRKKTKKEIEAIKKRYAH